MNFEHSGGHKPRLVLYTIPHHLAEHAVPFAQAVYKSYNEGELLTQAILGHDYSLWMHVLQITQRVTLTVTADINTLALNYVTEGIIQCRLNGFGELILSQNKYRLYHIPGQLPNEATFEPGYYKCIHVNFHPNHFISIARQYPRFNPMLEEAQNKMQQGTIGEEA